jgi:hypothetical protein
MPENIHPLWPSDSARLRARAAGDRRAAIDCRADPAPFTLEAVRRQHRRRAAITAIVMLAVFSASLTIAFMPAPAKVERAR